MRLYARNGYDWTARLSAIAAVAERIKTKSFTIDGEAVVLGPDGLSLFEGCPVVRPLEPRSSTLFDLIEHDCEGLRNLPFLGRKATLVRLLRDAEAGILLNEHVADDGPTVFGRACQRGADRVEEGRRRLPVWPAPRLDQGPQSRQHHRPARAERDFE